MKKRHQLFFWFTLIFLFVCLLLLINLRKTQSFAEDSQEIDSATVSDTSIDTQFQKDVSNNDKNSSTLDYTIETTNTKHNHNDEDMVLVSEYIPDIVVDLKYSTEDNFTGKVIYDFSDAYLRYGTVKKLSKVQEQLHKMGLNLKIWDAFRPVKAQFKLWEVCPNSTYVANPNKGFSSHSRGNTVDITIVDNNGIELQMPTGFDDFTAKADRDYRDCSKEERKNAELLELVMEKNGFKPYYGEWWHFSDNTKYNVEKNFVP